MRNQETAQDAPARAAAKTPLVNRLARVAFTFVMLNCSAVVAAIASMRGRKVWR